MTKIYYFSGTGNTLWSAKKIAEGLGNECELFNIGIEAYKDKIILEADTVILLFPSYAYGLPLIVSRFVKNALFKTSYIAAFVTFGTSPGGTLGRLSRILKNKNIASTFFGRIPSVENYIAIFGPQSTKTIEKRLLMQKQATENICEIIKMRKTNSINTFRPFSAFISFLFTLGLNSFYKTYYVNVSCNGCGICERVCPVSAVSMQENRPVFSSKCEHCQGCLNWCPQKAISFGRLRATTPRYNHPEITIADIARKTL